MPVVFRLKSSVRRESISFTELGAAAAQQQRAQQHSGGQFGIKSQLEQRVQFRFSAMFWLFLCALAWARR